MRLLVFIVVLAFIACCVTAVVMAEGTKQTYVGVENCKMCHPDIHGNWSKMPHARAFDLLVNVGEEKNPKCLGCHTTGYQQGGFVDAATTPDLRAVTCEACHGPGSEHNGDATKITREPSAKVCANCHMKLNLHSIPDK